MVLCAILPDIFYVLEEDNISRKILAELFKIILLAAVIEDL